MYYVQATLPSGFVMIEYRETREAAKRFYDCLPRCKDKRWGKAGEIIETTKV